MSNKWYYTIEIEKGVYTEGHSHNNIALTRKLLRNVNIQNNTCIDIGTQEAVIPILLKKSGAGTVVGYDRYALSEKINKVRNAYQVDFDYVSGIQLIDLPEKLDEAGYERYFDLVVFSGVLYHMINPLGLMALVRSLSKIDGLFLIETAAINDSKEMLLFNSRGELYGRQGSTYFVPTTSWLDYTLRMVGLMPIKAIYLGNINNPIRLALLCRSQSAPCPLEKDDEWVFKKFHEYIFRSESKLYLNDINRCQQQVTYEPYDDLVLNLNNEPLFKALRKHEPYKPLREELILSLNSKM